MMYKKRQCGFTLLEVMVALVIVTVALTAAIATTAEFTLHADATKQIVQATWVAENRLAERAVGPIRLQGEETQGRNVYYWRLDEQEEPGLKDIIKVAVSVYQEKDDATALLTLEGYVHEASR